MIRLWSTCGLTHAAADVRFCGADGTDYVLSRILQWQLLWALQFYVRRVHCDSRQTSQYGEVGTGWGMHLKHVDIYRPRLCFCECLNSTSCLP